MIGIIYQNFQIKKFHIFYFLNYNLLFYFNKNICLKTTWQSWCEIFLTNYKIRNLFFWRFKKIILITFFSDFIIILN